MTEKTMFERNLEMWERFVNQNMDLMFKSMEKAMEGTEAFQAQMGKAVDRTASESRGAQEKMAQAVNKALESSQSFQEQVAKAVNTAIAAQLDAALATLQTLERQVEALSEKFDDFVEGQSKEQ